MGEGLFSKRYEEDKGFYLPFLFFFKFAIKRIHFMTFLFSTAMFFDENMF